MVRLLTIVGPTASGKSELAFRLANRFKGEIICADSRTIYRGMNIGTAKPSATEQSQVPHHLLDIANPSQTYSAAEFKDQADAAIEAIRARGHLPILVGGSGLYIYAVIYNYQFPAGPRTQQRQRLEQLPIGQLVRQLQELDPNLASTIDLQNPRRVIRAIETAGQPRLKSRLRAGIKLIGLRPTDEELNLRIQGRTKGMLAAGLESEVRSLVDRFGLDLEAFQGPGYREVIQLLQGQINDSQLEEMVELHTKQLAKRQITWFKRNPDISWFPDITAAENYLNLALAESV
jgi:tRNA dimethylallyltransferase